MSIKTTHSITREFAINIILKKINDCTNEQLENVVEEVINNDFYNFIIVPEDKLKYENFKLDNINNLPDEHNDPFH